MSEPYVGIVHGPGTGPPPPPPRGFFVRTGTAARAGITMGSTLAMVISLESASIPRLGDHPWFLSWVYVIYFALTR